METQELEASATSNKITLQVELRAVMPITKIRFRKPMSSSIPMGNSYTYYFNPCEDYADFPPFSAPLPIFLYFDHTYAQPFH